MATRRVGIPMGEHANALFQENRRSLQTIPTRKIEMHSGNDKNARMQTGWKRKRVKTPKSTNPELSEKKISGAAKRRQRLIEWKTRTGETVCGSTATRFRGRNRGAGNLRQGKESHLVPVSKG